jgi:shikimate dehydrogenase
MDAIDNYAVFGNPVHQSKSPWIHQRFAELTQQNLHYVAQLIEVGDFARAAKIFLQSGKGLNVTVPFKLDAFNFAASHTDRAKRAAAVNTLALQADGRVLGDNTDGVGLINDMKNNLAWELSDKRVLILGAGGAVRGILEPLIKEKPRQLVIANRTLIKAQQLAEQFSDIGKIESCGYDDLGATQFDVVINGTSASLQGSLPPLPESLIHQHSCCYDLMYSANTTVFNSWATTAGAKQIADVLGMLVLSPRRDERHEGGQGGENDAVGHVASVCSVPWNRPR